MNKILRYSLSLVLALIANLSLMAAEPYKVLTFPDDNKANNEISSYTDTWKAIIGEDEWTIENFNNNKWGNNWTYIKCGRKNVESTATITSPKFSEKIGYIVVTIDKMTKDKVKSFYVYTDDGKTVSGTKYYPTSAELKTGDLITKIDGHLSNAQVKIDIECDKGSSNGLVQISKIAVYKEGDSPTTVDISNTPETAYSVAKAKELIDAGEGLSTQVYVKGIVSTAPTSLNETYGSLTYSISDDGKAENEFVVYSGLNIDGEKFTSADQIKVGNEVVVFGTLKKFKDTYEFDYNNTLISIKETTGITTIKANEATKNAPAYNLAGQKVSSSYKGVVVKAGKKFVQK